MGIYYFDSSAIIKRYVTEIGTPWIDQLCAARDATNKARMHTLHVGEIARVEVASTLTRKAKNTKEISEQDAIDAYKLFLTHLEEEYRIVLLTSRLLRSAAELAQRHVLRAYDAIQLAMAHHLGVTLKANNLTLIFVSGDDKLLQAAHAEGLAAENPFHHAEPD